MFLILAVYMYWGQDKIRIKPTVANAVLFNAAGGIAVSYTHLDVYKRQLLKNLIPEDLLKYGLIPEFIGRVPVIVTLDALDKDALIRILTEPKNALIKQYQRLLKMDQVELEFTDASLVAIADAALKRNTGARGLRSIVCLLYTSRCV